MKPQVEPEKLKLDLPSPASLPLDLHFKGSKTVASPSSSINDMNLELVINPKP